VNSPLIRWFAIYLAFGVFWALFQNLAGSMNGGHSVFVEIAANEPIRVKIVNVCQTLGTEIFLWPVQVFDHLRQALIP
jgi:hypothetical protein